VLPHSNGNPSGGAQLGISVLVALLVPLNLLGPIPTVGAVITSSVSRATMPKATVDKDGELRFGEHYVGFSTQLR
jgi:hypothetical protein